VRHCGGLKNLPSILYGPTKKPRPDKTAKLDTLVTKPLICRIAGHGIAIARTSVIQFLK
jgi:hypothetical protein